MRKFFETPDGKLLEIDSPFQLQDTNLREYELQTSDDDSTTFLPVIEEIENGYRVTVNTPNENKCDCKTNCDCNEKYKRNRFVFIELVVDDIRIKRYLSCNEKPEMAFFVPHGKVVSAYAFSTKGGLWTSALKKNA